MEEKGWRHGCTVLLWKKLDYVLAKPMMRAVLFLLLLTAVSRDAGLGALDFASFTLNPGDSVITRAEAFVAEMTDEDALAQTLMLGWQGVPPSPQLLEWIQKRGIGGVKVFGRNTPLPAEPSDDDKRKATLNLARTLGEYQREALARPLKIPLFVATDQEGGIIRHIKGTTSLTPGNMAVGASGYPRDAYLEGYYLGRELAIIGVNMNFAPTVDLFTNTGSTLIGTRSFGDDPVAVGLLGAAFARGLKDAGVIATAKHFPGHGDTALDSHGILPKIDATLEVLEQRELVPYKILAREGVSAIMSGHIAFPKTEAGNAPASLSAYFVTEILRGKLKYEGLIVTDDIAMNGATVFAGSHSRAALAALKAGNDVVMSSESPPLDDPLWTTLVDAMRRDDAFKKQVRSAAVRVLAAKLEYFKSENAPPVIPDTRKIAEALPEKEALRFYKDLAARAATTVYHKPGILPLTAGNTGNVLLASDYLDFFDVGQKTFPGAKRVWVHPDFRDIYLSSVRAADTVIFSLKNAEGLSLLRELRGMGKKVIVLSVLNPVLLKSLDWVDGAIALYSDSKESFIAGFSALSGRIEPMGKLPFALR